MLDFSHLDITQQDAIDQICVEFKRDWQTGQSPALAQYLDKINPDLRAVLRQMLEEIDPKANNLNSRITFTPKEDATYRLITTSFEQRSVGAYTLVIREFVAKQETQKE